MCRITTVFFLFLICGLNAVAADSTFSIKTIPVQLLENSNVVIRFHEATLNIHSAGKAVMKVRYAMTILKENAVENASLVLGFNQFTKIKHLKGTVYDKNGEKVEKIERDRFYNLSAISGFSTYEDNRMMACRPQYQTVPFTVEYNYEIDYDGILDYPDYFLVDDFNIAVEQAELNISVPDSVGIRYRQRNTASTCKIEKRKSVVTYSWNFINIPAMREEPYSPPITEIVPAVLLAPSSFIINKIRGNADSWKSFGLWFYQLLKDRWELSVETKQKGKNLTSGVSDTLQKIRILYKYLQDKTRYVSIQIGIGGWQPIAASEVDRLGYGDCKALTNYMLALLKAVGIDSYYTVVNAGENISDLVTCFPSNQFNHVILCIPVSNDSLWLECTSQDIPMGYLGTFTDDRSALIIRESGGFLCHTPVYSQDVNIQNRVGHVLLHEDGSAGMTVKTINHGLFYDKVLEILLSDETDKRKKILERISVSNFVLNNFDLKEHKAIFPSIEETLDMTIQTAGTSAGDFILLMLNQLTREDDMSSQFITRKNPVLIRRSTLKTDTVYFTLPAGLTFTGNHLNVSISSKFGEYNAVSSLTGQTIQYVRRLVIYKGTYPPESYVDFLDFFEKVANADAKKLALKSV